MLTFTAFVMFYLPCLATLGALKRELGTRRMLQVSALTVLIAWSVAWGIRWMGIFLS
jgi:ferrous iron transport protein B